VTKTKSKQQSNNKKKDNSSLAYTIKCLLEHPYDKFPIAKICSFVKQKFVKGARSDWLSIGLSSVLRPLQHSI